MQCSRCGQNDPMALRVDPQSQLSCLDCLTRMDFRTLGAGNLRTCHQCGNTESLWYVRQDDGTDLCLCCKQKQDSKSAMAWMAELDTMFDQNHWLDVLDAWQEDISDAA